MPAMLIPLRSGTRFAIGASLRPRFVGHSSAITECLYVYLFIYLFLCRIESETFGYFWTSKARASVYTQFTLRFAAPPAFIIDVMEINGKSRCCSMRYASMWKDKRTERSVLREQPGLLFNWRSLAREFCKSIDRGNRKKILISG